MNQTLIELRKKKHMSVSALRTFLTCPKKYELHYVRRVTPDYYPAALALGSAWHSAVACWLDDADADDAALDEQLSEELRGRLRRADVPVLFNDAEEDEDKFVGHAVEMFKTFRESVTRPKKVLGTEIAFETEVVHPSTGEVLPVPVIGAIDAVVVDEGGGVLWELKTAAKKWPTSGGQTEHNPQVTLYRKAARELGFGNMPLRVLVTTKGRVPQVQVVNAERSKADEAEVAELFFDVHRAIEAGVSYRNRGFACAGCQYASSCRP